MSGMAGVSGDRSQPRPLQIGLFLPSVAGFMDGATARWSDLLAMAEHAAAVGFDALWLADHFWFLGGEIRAEALKGLGLPVPATSEQAAPLGAWEAWSLLAALAAAVPRVDLGTIVTCTGYRQPVLLAKMADTVEEISGGRLILGLGAGDSAFEHRAYGYPFDHRVSRFEEALTIIRTLLREGQCDFAGTYYQVRDCELRPRGPRRQGPPILIGTLATGRRMLRLVVEQADLWNGWLAAGRSLPDVLPPVLAAVDRACAEHGVIPPRCCARSRCASPSWSRQRRGLTPPVAPRTRGPSPSAVRPKRSPTCWVPSPGWGSRPSRSSWSRTRALASRRSRRCSRSSIASTPRHHVVDAGGPHQWPTPPPPAVGSDRQAIGEQELGECLGRRHHGVVAGRDLPPGPG